MNSSFLKDKNHKRGFGVQITNLNPRTTRSQKQGPWPDQQPKRQVLKQISTKMDIQAIEIGAEEPTDHYQWWIIQYLIQTELNNKSAKVNYLAHQSELNEHMRGVLLNWLVEVHLRYKLMPETLFTTVNIIDSYLEICNIQKNNLQLLGITALWIAAKYEEVYQVPKINNLVFICDSAYRREQILAMESKILCALEFDLLKNNSYVFLELFRKHTELDEKDYYLARYLIQMALLEYSMKKYSARCITAAAIFFIQKIRKMNPCWSNVLEQFTQYRQQDIRSCARDICTLLQTVDQNSAMQSLRKKYLLPEYREVSKIKVGEKNKQ